MNGRVGTNWEFVVHLSSISYLHVCLTESLHLDQMTHVVLDWSWRDVKLRRMIDIPEIKADLFKLLQKYILPRAKLENVKIGLL